MVAMSDVEPPRRDPGSSRSRNTKLVRSCLRFDRQNVRCPNLRAVVAYFPSLVIDIEFRMDSTGTMHRLPWDFRCARTRDLEQAERVGPSDQQTSEVGATGSH